MRRIKEALTGIIAVLAVMLVSMNRRLPEARRFSSGITTLALAGIVLLVTAGAVSADEEITSLPFTTNEDGERYFLTTDLICADTSTAGITIANNNVIIDGQGNKITGSASAGACADALQTSPAAHSGIRKSADVKNTMIEDIEIVGFCTGIGIEGAYTYTGDDYNAEVTGCKIHDNGDANSITHGVHLTGANNCTITKNEIYNQDGTADMGSCGDGGNGISMHGVVDAGGDYNTITCNYLHDNAKCGLHAKFKCMYNTISYNNVTENAGAGIMPECKKSDWNTFEYNYIKDNGPYYGFYTRGSNNVIRYNTIINTKGVSGHYYGIYIGTAGMPSPNGRFNDIANNSVCGSQAEDIMIQGTAPDADNTVDDNTCDLSSGGTGNHCPWTCDHMVPVYFDFDSDTHYSKELADCLCGIVSGGVCACCNPGSFHTTHADLLKDTDHPTNGLKLCQLTAGDDVCDCQPYQWRPYWEYGDAPDDPADPADYPSLFASDGARHEQTTTEILGLASTGDSKDYEHDANVPDLDQFDDGLVTMAILPVAGQTVDFEVTESMGVDSLVANILIDLNRDGDWADAGEHVVQNMAVNVVSGEATVTSPAFDATGASVGQTWLRLTLTRSDITVAWDGTMTGHAATTPFEYGETEDYEIEIGDEPKPDLTITEKHEEWIDKAAGTYSITYTICNIGTATASTSNTKVMIDGSPTGVPDTVPELAPTECLTRTLSGPYTVTDGYDIIKLCADGPHAIPESDEDNNCIENRWSQEVDIYIDQPQYVDPQSQFTINIMVDPKGSEISAVQYDLYYNTSVVWAEWANPGPFLNETCNTDVTVLSIDNLWDVAGHTGKITYAETTLGIDGGDLPSVNTEGILTTIHFSAIGERGRYTQMDLNDSKMSDPLKNDVLVNITDCGVTIYDNQDPVADGTSMYRFSNVASKFQCFAVLCPCLSNGGDDLAGWGENIAYVRWDFGDGQYGTSEGVDPCEVKKHEYTTWNWNEATGEYDPFIAYLTVRDDGEPQLSNTIEVPVMVYIAGDTNGDGVVDIFDAACVGKHWGQHAAGPVGTCDPYWAIPQADEADLNNDNDVDTIDAMIVGTNWNHLAYYPYYQE